MSLARFKEEFGDDTGNVIRHSDSREESDQSEWKL